ncbi:Regulatory protein RecX [Dehalogenimonas sp. WBC-2]|nr:Regulatory protein RecX [Dehalogenimonas sp. WBC-2]
MPKWHTGAKLLTGTDEAEELSADSSSLESLDERPDACYESALRLLDHRARSESEVRRRLADKGFDQEKVESTLNRLKASGVINDQDFARLWTENRTASRPRSAFMVKRELQIKGIAGDTAEEAVAVIDDAESAYRAALPRVRRLSALSPKEARLKLSAFLKRRGFSWDVVEATMKRLEAEESDNQVQKF